LPGRVRVCEVDPQPGGGVFDPPVVEHLVALVPGQRPRSRAGTPVKTSMRASPADWAL
jgi:hypothetical protein